MLLGVQVQVRVQGHLSPQIIYCYYFAGSVQSNHQYAHKWKENIRISQCISCSDLSTEVEHLDMWQKKNSYIFSADLFSAEIEHIGVAYSISLV